MRTTDPARTAGAAAIGSELSERTRRRRGPTRPSFCFLAAWLALSTARPAAAAAGTQGREPADSLLAAIATRALASEQVLPWALGLVDSIGGRLSGTPAGTRAEAWAAAQLRTLGFDTVWFETVPFRAWERGSASAAVVEPGALAGHAVAVAAWGYSPPAELTGAPVVDLGRGDAAALQRVADAAKGAILLCDAVPPELIHAASAAGAAAILRISPDPGRLVQARVAPVEKPPAPLPVAATSLEDGLWLRRQVAYGDLRLRLSLGPSIREGEARNVVGEWRGRAQPTEVVLLGGHLDAWDLGAGAIDRKSVV